MPRRAFVLEIMPQQKRKETGVKASKKPVTAENTMHWLSLFKLTHRNCYVSAPSFAKQPISLATINKTYKYTTSSDLGF